MKKTILLLVVLVSFASHSSDVFAQATGFVFGDALTTYNLLRKGTSDDKEKAFRIILYYTDKDSFSEEVIKDVIEKNEFLKKSSLLSRLGKVDLKNNALHQGEPTGGGSGLYGLNVATYADGIAKFLIQRGKQELSMAFFTKMEKEFDKNPELAFIFPLTVTILKDIENHNVFTLLQELRDAFVKDLTQTPDNLLSLRDITNENCPKNDTECASRIDKIKIAIKKNEVIISLLTMQGMVNGNNIITILNRVVNDKDISKDSTSNLTNYIRFAAMMTDLLRSTDDKNGLFINEANLRNLFFDRELLNIFLGLAYEKYKDLPSHKGIKINSKDLKGILIAIRDKKEKFSGMLSSLDNVNLAYRTIRDQVSDGKKLEPEHYAALISSSVMVAANLIKSLEIIVDPETLDKEVKSLLVNIKIGADVCIDIQQKNYTGLYNDIIHLIDHNKILNETVREKVVKYLSFAANVASARSSDEINSALEAVALPPGSFSVKQKSGWNIAFNAYIGYAWDFKSGLQARGLYAPLGFAVSKGLGKKNGGAVSAFASIIDVGALVSYRLTNGMTDSLKQEVRLESIISPSLQLAVAIPRLPVSVCAGWRQTPKLFFQGKKEFTAVDPKNVLNVSILIDIPVFNIWTRSYE